MNDRVPDRDRDEERNSAESGNRGRRAIAISIGDAAQRAVALEFAEGDEEQPWVMIRPEQLSAEAIELERIEQIASPQATHLRFRVATREPAWG